jgi:hypothetical protein
MLMILVVLFLFAVLGSLPLWPKSREWGNYPGGDISLVLFILLILFFVGRI